MPPGMPSPRAILLTRATTLVIGQCGDAAWPRTPRVLLRRHSLLQTSARAPRPYLVDGHDQPQHVKPLPGATIRSTHRRQSRPPTVRRDQVSQRRTPGTAALRNPRPSQLAFDARSTRGFVTPSLENRRRPRPPAVDGLRRCRRWSRPAKLSLTRGAGARAPVEPRKALDGPPSSLVGSPRSHLRRVFCRRERGSCPRRSTTSSPSHRRGTRHGVPRAWRDRERQMRRTHTSRREGIESSWALAYDALSQTFERALAQPVLQLVDFLALP